MNNKWLDKHDKSCWVEIPRQPVMGCRIHSKIDLDDYIVGVSYYRPLTSKKDESITLELQFKSGEDPSKPSNSKIKDIYDTLHVNRGAFNHPKYCNVKAPFMETVRARLVGIKFAKPIAQLTWVVKE